MRVKCPITSRCRLPDETSWHFPTKLIEATLCFSYFGSRVEFRSCGVPYQPGLKLRNSSIVAEPWFSETVQVFSGVGLRPVLATKKAIARCNLRARNHETDRTVCMLFYQRYECPDYSRMSIGRPSNKDSLYFLYSNQYTTTFSKTYLKVPRHKPPPTSEVEYSSDPRPDPHVLPHESLQSLRRPAHDPLHHIIHMISRAVRNRHVQRRQQLSILLIQTSFHKLLRAVLGAEIDMLDLPRQIVREDLRGLKRC